MITAIVLIHVEVGKAGAVAEALADLPGVSEAYSVAGHYDVVAVIHVDQYEKLADLIPERISKVPGIQTTETLLAFRYYSRRDLERTWSLGMDEEKV